MTRGKREPLADSRKLGGDKSLPYETFPIQSTLLPKEGNSKERKFGSQCWNEVISVTKYYNKAAQ
jgi:hypothetical protein